MRVFNILSSAILLLTISYVCEGRQVDKTKAIKIQEDMRRELGKPKHPPKHPSPSTSTSSSSSSSSSSGSSGSGSSGSSSSGASKATTVISPTKKSSATTLLGVGAAGMAIAAAAMFHKRRAVVTKAPHPLEGSLAKRVENFEKFVGPRRGDAAINAKSGLDYNAMSDNAAMV